MSMSLMILLNHTRALIFSFLFLLLYCHFLGEYTVQCVINFKYFYNNFCCLSKILDNILSYMQANKVYQHLFRPTDFDKEVRKLIMLDIAYAGFQFLV